MLRDKLVNSGFYLQAHPEDAHKVALELMGVVEYKHDSYGHLTEPKDK